MIGAAGAVSPAALADGKGVSTGLSAGGERRLRAAEKELLGARHAAEHAAQRATTGSRRGRVRVARAARRARSVTGRGDLVARAAAVEQDGQWSAPFSIPAVGIHAAVLPTGKVMWFHRPQSGAERFQIAIWDPETGLSKRVAPPLIDGKAVNLFCGGQSFMADGRLLVTGGQIAGPTATTTDKGLKTVYTFNPFNETWTRQPDMAEGRWYPSQALLPDGRTVIMSGKDSTGTPGAPFNNDVEVFTPSADLDGVGTTSLLGRRAGMGDPPSGGLYPHLFAMPSGRTLIAGPKPQDSWFLNSLGTGRSYSWADAPDPVDHSYGTSVILPSDTPGSSRVALIGGGRPATARVDVFDEADATAGWAAAPSLNVPRSYGNTVMLPDGSMVAIGGGPFAADGRSSDFTAESLQVELYDPATRAWRLGAAQAEGRAYHSTAVLLPDGRVVSAGDDTNGGYNVDTAEIYSPPYLFKGPRPTITSAPSGVGYGGTFTTGFGDSDVTRAVLVAPGATTHANDMSQRYVPLTVTGRAEGSVTLSAPANANIAPPGYYMLFLLNADGVPSVAEFVRVGGAPTAPPVAPGNPATPTRPADPAPPVTPPTVAEPATPSDPAKPADPATPAAPAGPRDPSTPSSTRKLRVIAQGDTMVNQSNRRVRYGRRTTLVVDRTVGGGPRTAIHSYLRFKVPSLAPGEVIAKAELALYARNPTANGPAVHRTLNARTVAASETMTWASGRASRNRCGSQQRATGQRPSCTVGDFGRLARTNTTYRTALSGITRAGLISLELAPASGDAFGFASRETVALVRRPALILTVRRP